MSSRDVARWMIPESCCLCDRLLNLFQFFFCFALKGMSGGTWSALYFRRCTSIRALVHLQAISTKRNVVLLPERVFGRVYIYIYSRGSGVPCLVFDNHNWVDARTYPQYACQGMYSRVPGQEVWACQPYPIRYPGRALPLG